MKIPSPSKGGTRVGMGGFSDENVIVNEQAAAIAGSCLLIRIDMAVRATIGGLLLKFPLT